MYDYSENENSRKKFILNYKKNGNQLIVKFANGVRITMPYTKDNEEKLLKKMEDQVKNYPKLIKKYKNILRNFKKIGITSTILFILSLVLIYLWPYEVKIFWVCIQWFIDFFSGLISFYSADIIIEMNKNIKDLEKCKFFIEEKEFLNSNIKMNENILHKVSHKTKKMVNNAQSSEVFTINTISDFSLKDLKRIRDYIALERELEKEFNFEYPDNSTEKSSYTKKIKSKFE